jgi:hypothetical protein
LSRLISIAIWVLLSGYYFKKLYKRLAIYETESFYNTPLSADNIV